MKTGRCASPLSNRSLVVLLVVVALGSLASRPTAAQVNVMQTGTTYSVASGDDGSNPFGWLFPASRFSEANGTITDRLTGLIWLKDSQCLKPSSKLSEAQQRIAELNAGTRTGCQGYTSGTHNDWRLPNLNELATLVHSGRLGPGQGGLGFYGFNAQSPSFWSSTSWHADPSKVWTWRSNNSQLVPGQDKEQGNTSFGVLAVRGPSPILPPSGFPIMPIQTGQTLCYGGAPNFNPISCSGTGQDGELQLGADIDLPKRFETASYPVIGTLVITDNLTDLQWVVSTTCLPKANWSTSLSTAANLGSAANLACRPLAIGGAWRLPNWRELRTLMHYGQNGTAMYAPLPLSADTDSPQYWTSSVMRIGDENRYIYIDSGDGSLRNTADPSPLRSIIAVRGATHQTVTVTPTVLPFGTITVGQSSTAKLVTVKSSGDAIPLGTIRVRSGAAHFYILNDNCSGKVPGNNGCTITIIFSPKATGALTGVLEITDLVTVSLTGTGSGPTISVDPSSPVWWLLSEPLQHKSITVTAGGSGQLEIDSLSFAGTNPNDFSVVSEDCTAKPLNPGQSCTITLAFFPGAGGDRIAELKITSNAPDQPVLSVTLVTLGTAPFISLSPSILDYGSQPIGSTTDKDLTISNTGNGGPLTIDSLKITGSGSNSYTITGDTCPPSGLAAGESCKLTISFTPSAGLRIANLEVKSSDPARGKLDVSLVGTGVTIVADPEPDTSTPDSYDSDTSDVADLQDGAGDTLDADLADQNDASPNDIVDTAPGDTSDLSTPDVQIDAQADTGDQGSPTDTAVDGTNGDLEIDSDAVTEIDGIADSTLDGDAVEHDQVDDTTADVTEDGQTTDSGDDDGVQPDSSDATLPDVALDADDGGFTPDGALPTWGITPSGTAVGETMSLHGNKSSGCSTSLPNHDAAPSGWLLLLAALLAAALVRRSRRAIRR